MSRYPLQKIVLMALIAAFILTTASGVAAFDKQRKGFILGFGIGPGVASFTETLDSADVEETFEESKFGFTTDFKIGYAPSEKLMVYWMSKVVWVGKDDTVVTDIDESITAVTGVGGVGLTYFLKPEAPSLFISLGVGLGVWSYPFEDYDPLTGLGITGGFGYEFSPNWSLEASILYGKPSGDDVEWKYTSDFISAGLTINVTGY